MSHIVHVVVTENFAGTERYVTTLANETVRRGHRVSVIGGKSARMRAELDAQVRWLPGGTVPRALRSLAGLGRVDVCHAHLTAAEAVVVALRRRHRARTLSTRHIAAPRGASRLGGLAGPWIARGLDAQIAISEYVASRIERRPDHVILTGVPDCELLWRPENRTVLVLQRLEPEKDTLTAVRAWHASGLAEQGWRLRIVGDGVERDLIERYVADHRVPSVDLVGRVTDVRSELARAGLLLATTPVEALGLVALEAMAAGVPVVASATGGYLETVGRAVPETLFDDEGGAARLLRRLSADIDLRRSVAMRQREMQRAVFTIRAMTNDVLVASTGATALLPRGVDRSNDPSLDRLEVLVRQGDRKSNSDASA